VLTNKLECPPGYDPILAFQTNNPPGSKGPWANLTECRGRNGLAVGGQSKLYFGGIYSEDQDFYPNRVLIKNAVTGAYNCPEFFSAQPLFDCLNNRICLSENPRAISNAVPFGGFISSCMPQSSQVCKQGYSKVRINTYNACTLYYCVQLKTWSRPTLVKPPYTSTSANLQRKEKKNLFGSSKRHFKN
jgi:hypothetical protein